MQIDEQTYGGSGRIPAPEANLTMGHTIGGSSGSISVSLKSITTPLEPLTKLSPDDKFFSSTT